MAEARRVHRSVSLAMGLLNKLGLIFSRVNMYASTWICTKQATEGYFDDSRPSTSGSSSAPPSTVSSPMQSHSRNSSSELAPLNIGEASL